MDLSSVARSDPGSSLDANWQFGAFMQVFVRSYQDRIDRLMRPSAMSTLA